jgi:hypothetical protein
MDANPEVMRFWRARNAKSLDIRDPLLGADQQSCRNFLLRDFSPPVLAKSFQKLLLHCSQSGKTIFLEIFLLGGSAIYVFFSTENYCS